MVRLLGTGGEGETWLCIDQRNKQEVAIKLVRRPIPRSITQIIQVRATDTARGVCWGWAVARLALGRGEAGAQQEMAIKLLQAQPFASTDAVPVRLEESAWCAEP